MITLITEKRTQMLNGEPGDGIDDSAKYPAQPPPPVPPAFAKTEIYRDPTEFAEVDRRAINVAQEDQKTFTDLVSARASWTNVTNLVFSYFWQIGVSKISSKRDRKKLSTNSRRIVFNVTKKPPKQYL
jgi:hypothetical protein